MNLWLKKCLTGPPSTRAAIEAALASLPGVELVRYSDYEKLEASLAECYRLTGADPDGDSDSMLAQHAVEEVRRLRGESDRAEGERDERILERDGYVVGKLRERARAETAEKQLVEVRELEREREQWKTPLRELLQASMRVPGGSVELGRCQRQAEAALETSEPEGENCERCGGKGTVVGPHGMTGLTDWPCPDCNSISSTSSYTRDKG